MDLVVDAKNGFAYVHPKPPPGPPSPGSKPPAARQVTTHPPVTGGIWTLADDVRLSGDNLFLISGNFKRNKGNWAGALADFNRALDMNSKNAAAYSQRGVARQIEGDFSGALSDYDKFIAAKPEDSDWERLYRQTLLWRLGRAPEDFSKSLAGCKEGWVKTLALFLVGKLDEKALLAAAEKSDGESVPVQKALARYYIGMMRLSKGDKAGARDSFRKCRAAGMTSDDEYHFAGAELRRLGK
jgi:lipoprotein NlpI